MLEVNINIGTNKKIKFSVAIAFGRKLQMCLLIYGNWHVNDLGLKLNI